MFDFALNKYVSFHVASLNNTIIIPITSSIFYSANFKRKKVLKLQRYLHALSKKKKMRKKNEKKNEEY